MLMRPPPMRVAHVSEKLQVQSFHSKPATSCQIPRIKISTRMGGDGYPLSGVSSARGQRSEG